MSKNMVAVPATRNSALTLGLAALLLSLAGAVPTYGIIGSVAGIAVGILARSQAKRSGSAAGAGLAVFAIYLGLLRIVLTLVSVFLFGDLLTSSTPRHVTMPPHVTAPARPNAPANSQP